MKSVSCLARLAEALLVLALLIPVASVTTSAQKDAKAELSLAERVLVASKIYASIPIYFAHWQNVPGLDLDDAYKTYLAKVIAATDPGYSVPVTRKSARRSSHVAIFSRGRLP